MKNWQAVLITLMCVVLVALLVIPFIREYGESFGKHPQPTQSGGVTEPTQAPQPTTTNAPEPTTPEHTVKVTVTFEEGKMICRITEACSCGKETALKSSSTTKEMAMNLINAIGCDVFYLTQSEVELPITREELIQMVEGYAFAS